MRRFASVSDYKRKVLRAIIGFTLIFVLMMGFFALRTLADTNASKVRYTSVRIQEGQTLTQIASDHMNKGYDTLDEYIDEIVYINRLDSPDNITAGAYLCLPYRK